MTAAIVPGGWGVPTASSARTAHYYAGKESLCKRWSWRPTFLDADQGPEPDQCVVCRRELTRLQRRTTPARGRRMRGTA